MSMSLEVPTLKNLISTRLFNLISRQTDDIIYNHLENNTISQLDIQKDVGRVWSTYISLKIDELPDELVDSFASCVTQPHLDSVSRLAIMTFMSSKLNTFTSIHCRFVLHGYLETCCASLRFGLRTIDLSSWPHVPDSILIALSQSGARKSLKKIKLDVCAISDAVCENWQQFVSLEKCVFHSSLATIKTLRAILNLPTLERITFRSTVCSEEEILQEILKFKQSKKLRLEKLWTRNPYALSMLSSLANEWTQPIEKLAFSGSPLPVTADSEFYKLLVGKFSHLTRLPVASLNDWSAAIPFRNLRKLRLEYRGNMMQDNYNTLALSLPDLAELIIRSDPSSPIDLSAFSSLRRLQLLGSENPNPWKISAFPPSLTNLSYDMSESAPLDDLVAPLLDLHKLEWLVIKAAISWSKKNVLDLLSSLQRLRDMRIESPSRRPRPQTDTCVASHPAIESFHISSLSDSELVLGNLPKLQHFKAVRVAPLHPLPNLYQVRNMSILLHAWIYSYLPTFPNLKDLSVYWDRTASWADLLSRLPQLQSLEIQDAIVSPSGLQQISTMLPNLRHLTLYSLVQDEQESSAAVVLEPQFPRLLSLILQVGGPEKSSYNLSFQGINFACLTSLILQPSAANILARLDIVALPNLTSFALRQLKYFQEGNYQQRIRISKCPRLHTLSFGDLSLSFFELTELPHLSRIAISSMEAESEQSLHLDNFSHVEAVMAANMDQISAAIFAQKFPNALRSRER